MLLIHDAQQQQWLQFTQPQTVVVARSPDAIAGSLEAVQRHVDMGHYAAGFIAYEAAPGCEVALVAHEPDRFPLLWFGIYGEPQPVALPPAPTMTPLDWQPSITEAEYRQAIAAVKAQIAAGNTYQVNFSFRLRSPLSADPWGLFLQMVQAQSADYGAYLDLGDWVIASASPELFFSRQGEHIVSRPMKGTVPRGLTLPEDDAQAAWLRQSPKNQAENAMIVDMVRHDLGQVAQVGSVCAPELFALERYPTVWQMTSTVQARSGASTAAVLQALFPPASITGAPKASTTALIAQLEASPRHIYTGSIGFMRPDGRSQFNVAIRTVLMDRQRQQAEYGVGGGIVWDSQAEEEYAECCTKAQVLHYQQPAFSLLESLRWTPASGYFLLERHLARLGQSARYFGFTYSPEAAQQWLQHLARQATAPQKVRLLLHRDGTFSGEAIALPAATSLILGLAPQPVNSSDVFLRHKTTHRQVYQQARQAAPPEWQDVLLWNERGEVTETTLGNIVIEVEGQRYTPPVTSGLLPGTLRAHLLDQGTLQERVITPEQASRCDRLFVINSVRGWQPVTALHTAQPNDRVLL